MWASFLEETGGGTGGDDLRRGGGGGTHELVRDDHVLCLWEQFTCI